jgi:hypothetical protein
MHESRRRRESDAIALLAGGKPQGQGDVSLSRTRWPKGDAVLSLLDPFAARQLQHQGLVERRLRGEVERVEAFDLGKARLANPALDVAPFAVDALQFSALR